MTDSIYAPPESDVEVATPGDTSFYVVAPRKFYLLSVLTFDLYLIYWFYRNWRIIKDNNNEDIWPVPRGLFYIFFTHALFNDVDEKIKALGKPFAWSPGTTATLVVILAITTNILDRLSARNIGSPITDIIALVLVPVIPAIMLKAQRAINFACEDPDGEGNSHFSLANWVWSVLGGLVWLMAVLGAYLLVFEPEIVLE